MKITSKGFKKPAENEYYSIEDANHNAQLSNDLFEGVDSAIGQKADSTSVDEALALKANVSALNTLRTDFENAKVKESINLNNVNLLSYISSQSPDLRMRHYGVVPGSTLNGAPDISWGWGIYGCIATGDSFCIYISQSNKTYINRSIGGTWYGWKEVMTTDRITVSTVAPFSYLGEGMIHQTY